jgi:hypothetical protein
MLCDELSNFLMGYGVPANSAWFQRDGATPHDNNAVLLSLYDVFEDRVQSDWYPALFENDFNIYQIHRT